MVNTKILTIGIGIVIAIAIILFALSFSMTTTNFDSQFLNDNSNLIQQNANASDLIFTGKIVSIGTPPIDWSGKYELTQKVKYEVSSTIKGTYTNSIIEVSYLIVKGAHYTDSSMPQLSSEFQIGSEKIVMVDENNGVYENIHDKVGTFPFSQTNEDALRKLI